MTDVFAFGDLRLRFGAFVRLKVTCFGLGCFRLRFFEFQIVYQTSKSPRLHFHFEYLPFLA